MATPTYSASISANVSGGVDGTFAGQTIKSTLVPDTSMNGYNSGVVSSRNYLLSQNEQVLAKGPDGGLHWYRVKPAGPDPNSVTLEYVGP